MATYIDLEDIRQNRAMPASAYRCSQDDKGNAEALYDFVGEDFRYCGAYGLLLRNETHYTAECAESHLIDAAATMLRSRANYAMAHNDLAGAKFFIPNKNRIDATVGLFQYDPRIVTPVTAFDSDPDVINAANGVVDLRTGELIAHDTSQLFTYCAPVPHTPDADTSKWLQFCHETVAFGMPAQQEIIDFLQLCVGYSLTGRTNEEGFLYLYGPTRAGKGTFIETIQAMMPFPMSSPLNFATISKSNEGDTKNHALAELKACRLVVADESKRNIPLDVAKVKKLTGGGAIQAEKKYHDPFSFIPQFKLWILSNWELNMDVEDDAGWNRPRVIPFPKSYAGQEVKNLKEILASPEHLAGVFRWAVEGAMRLNLYGPPSPEYCLQVTY